MFNLLPQEDQDILLQEYRLRLTIVGLLFLSVLWIVASIATIPALFLSYQIEGYNRQVVEALKKEITDISSEDISKELSVSNKKIAALAVDEVAKYSHSMVGNILAYRVRGIKIFGLEIQGQNSATRDITITGEASSREALLAFVKTLERDKGFSNVTVPVSDFAPVTDINFSIILKTK